MKEHRGVQKTEDRPSGSGGGVMPHHQPSEFYYELLFLVEHLGAPR